MPSGEKIYFQVATKDDLDSYFTEGQKISDADWDSFCDDFDGNWEYAYESLNEIMADEFECSACNLYDYRCVQGEGDEPVCPNCGEEKDLLND